MSEAMAEMVDMDATVIPHGVNFEKFRPIDQGRAQNLVGWSQEKKHVLFPYHPTRNVKDYPKAKRVVAEVNQALAEEVDLKVVHDVEHEDVYKYMNASDALLLTSKREGSPNSVKEALACNLPIVSTHVGWVSKHLSNVSNSYVGATEPELVEHLSSVIRSGQQSDGRNHVADLGLDQMAEDILSVYKRALS
jgi:glycosyltransferase involved in cell wall biosynthesis